jgi:hypothetical protein
MTRVSAYAGQIARGVFLALLVCISFAQLPAAQAADGPGAAEPKGLRFALVWRLKGDVHASNGGRSRTLREGDLVYVGERVRAESNSEAVLKTDDGGMIAVRPGAEFAAEGFSARGEKSDNFVMRVFTGSLRIITGWIGRANRENYRVNTPTATIGVRGTDHEPYVLDKDIESSDGAYRPGTYDKVNRGGTTLESAGKSVDIDPGKVGFVRAPGKQRTRALMTLLLPVVLERVPGFYVPGSFDAELDAFAATADDTGARQLARRQQDSDRGPVARAPEAALCEPQAVARKWLAALDGAIQRRDGAAVIVLFAPDAAIRATVLDPQGGTATLDLNRQEFSDSALAALASLSDYRQRRLSVKGESVGSASCGEIKVSSTVSEQGKQGGKPYRFDSRETYLLQVRDGAWVAVRAETSQR